MHETLLTPVALGAPVLISVYWVCLIVGGGLLLISVWGAAGDHGGLDTNVHVDTGVDVHADAGVDHPGDFGHGPAHAGTLTRWFSIRFAVFFLAVFGLVGVVLTHGTQWGTWAVAGSAVVAGFGVGQSVHQILRKVQRTSGDSTPQSEDYVNKPARVTIRIEAHKKGEVAVRVGPSDRYVPAVAKQPDRSFPLGAQVAVVSYQGGVAEVVSREEYEFLKDSKGV